MFKGFKNSNINKYKNFDINDYFYHLLPWGYIYENKEFVIKKSNEEELKNFPIIITKDGSLQTTFKIRGKDLDSCTAYELVNVTERLNNSLKQLDNNWTLHINAIRREIKKYDKKNGANTIPVKILEIERAEFFNSGLHFESDFYITLTWLTPEDKLSKVKNLLFTKTEEIKLNTLFKANLKYYNDELLKIFTLLNECLDECEILDIEETLSYYHYLVSDEEHELKVPKAYYLNNQIIATGIELPEVIKKEVEKQREYVEKAKIAKEAGKEVEKIIFEVDYTNIKEEVLSSITVDSYITDCKLTGGVEPIVGNDYIKTVSILNFPGSSIPGILDKLNRTDIPYIWSTRYIMLEKIVAKKVLDDYFDLWWSARKTFKDLFGETFTKTETVNQSNSAIGKAAQVSVEREKLENDETTIGYYTSTIILKGKDKAIVEKHAQQVKTLINSIGFVAEIEDFYALDAYLGSLPGSTYFNVRRPPMNSKVLSHLIPLNAVWAGDRWNKHLKTPALLYCQTVGSTPYRLNLHYNDVGHTIIVGPTGAGKSVLLATIQASFLGYKNSKVIGFDKGASTRVLNKACNGLFYDLGENGLRFQPLRECHLDNEKEWCQEWIEGLLEDNKVEINPEIKKYIWQALTSLAELPLEKRTMTSFVNLVGGQSKLIKEALEQYQGNGAYAKYFDGNSDFLRESNYTIFEMEKLAEVKNIITPALDYLFHVIETKMIDKVRPTLITLDESWLFLDNPKFEKKIEAWLRVMRKNNTSVVFATQSLADVANSRIKSVILTQCYSRIYLPNPNAVSDTEKSYYKIFDLNDREIEILYRAIPKRQYYFKSPKGARLFELALSPLELAYLATSAGNDQEKCKELYSLDENKFNIEWLNYKGFDGNIIVNKVQEMIEEGN